MTDFQPRFVSGTPVSGFDALAAISNGLEGLPGVSMETTGHSLQAPRLQGHKVYNFEVENTHTYIAGDIRVHNQSVLSFITAEEKAFLTDLEDIDGDGHLDYAVFQVSGATSEVEVTQVRRGDSVRAIRETTLSDGKGNLFYVYVELDENNNVVDQHSQPLHLQHLGGDIFKSLTPFLTRGFLDDDPNVLAQIAVDTVAGTVLQNLGEVIFAFGQRAAIDQGERFSIGEALEEISNGAFEDFGGELVVNGIQTTISVVNSLIMSEIFENINAEGVPGAIFKAVVASGVNALVTQGAKLVLKSDFFNSLVDALELSNASQVVVNDFVSTFIEGFEGNKFLHNPAGIIFTAVINEILPPLETSAGQIASLVTGIVLRFATNIVSTFANFGGPIIAVISWVVGKLFDSLFGRKKHPEAYTNVEFDEETGHFVLADTWARDGGNIGLSRDMAQMYVDAMNEFVDTMMAQSHNYGELGQWSFGHYHSYLKNAGRNGENFATAQAAYINAYINDLKAAQLKDGQLAAVKALENLNLEDLHHDAQHGTDRTGYFSGDGASRAEKELDIYQQIAANLQIAHDYHTYLENMEAVNTLVAMGGQSAFAAGWLATIQAAYDMGLHHAYERVGDDNDNVFFAAEGDDTIAGGAGDDLIKTYGGHDELRGDGGNDTLIAGLGNDTAFGGDGDDSIDLGHGDDWADGGNGDDTIAVGDGKKTVHGGAGLDVVSFRAAAHGVTFDLATNTATGQGYEDDHFTGFEGAEGSDFGDDEIIGTTGANIIRGHGGNDTLRGGDGNDLIEGGAGADSLSGGAGIDTLSYVSSMEGVHVDLTSHSGQGGDAEGDVLTGFENLIGSSQADRLIGDSASNELRGGEGNDTLNALAGHDVIIAGAGDDELFGGAGSDRLEGGAGNDTYHYARGDGYDTIFDYAEGFYEERYNYYEYVQTRGGKRAQYANELRTGYKAKYGEVDGGIDTLRFASSIQLSDLILRFTNDDLLIELRDDANADLVEAGDQVQIESWSDTNNRIENFEFSNGDILDFSQITAAQNGMGAADHLQGGAAHEFLSGGSNRDTIDGADGDDIITGGADADDLSGGAGRDFLFGDEGDDVVRGNTGRDYLIGGAGNDTLEGGAGDDKLSGEDGADSLLGGGGNDYLTSGRGADFMNGGAGNDTYFYFRGDGVDRIHDYAAYEETYQEKTGNMVWQSGKHGRWVEETRTAKRMIQYDGGHDTLQFGPTILIEDLFVETNDLGQLLIGLREDGITSYEQMDDRVEIIDWSNEMSRIETFWFGDDRVVDMSSITFARSGFGNADLIQGTSGGDFLSGGGGNDTLNAGDGDDILTGNEGSDVLSGGAGYDDLFGGEGDDKLDGEGGNDHLLGGAGNDTLHGGAGNDVLSGGAGNDLLNGGAGNDVYFFKRGDGHDTIDETAYETVTEEYTYETGNQIQQTIGWGKTAQTIWINEVRTGYREKTQAVEGGDDTVQFGRRIDLSDLLVSMAGANLLVELAPETDGPVVDSLTIKNWTTEEFRIETFRFTNNFALDVSGVGAAKSGGTADDVISSDATSTWLSGRDGDDSLVGADAQADILVGGSGQDTLEGGTGNDTYVFNRGDGADVIFDTGSDGDLRNGGGDKLLFGAGITADDLLLNRDGNDLLIYVHDANAETVELSEITDVIRIRNWHNDANRIEILQFFDGVDADISEIDEAITVGAFANDDEVQNITEELRGMILVEATEIGWNGHGHHAVDGQTGPGNWYHSRWDAAPEIKLNLQSEYALKSIKIYNRAEHDNNLNGAVVTLLDANGVIVHTFAPLTGSGPGKIWELELSAFVDAQYVRLEDADNYLSIAEIEVFGKMPGHRAQGVGTNAGDWINGDELANFLEGRAGNDFLFGGKGDDRIYAGAGDDVVDGGDGDDQVHGAEGDDVIRTGAGDDQIDAGDGSDMILAGDGDDVIVAGGGDDQIVGGQGDDIYYAGTGRDTYLFGFEHGNDRYINNGDAGVNGTDEFYFEENVTIADIWFERVDNDLRLKLLGSTDTVTFEGWFFRSGPSKHISKFVADGHELSYGKVNALLSMMQDVKVNDGTTVYDLREEDITESMMGVIEGNWVAQT